MKRQKILISFLFALLFFLPIKVGATNQVVINLFYGDGCPHCKKEEEFLNELKGKYDNIEIKKYEVWYNKDNQELLTKVKKSLGKNNSYVPFTVIDDKSLVGFSDEYKDTILEYVNYCTKNECVDHVKNVINNNLSYDDKDINEYDNEDNKGSEFNIPLLGKVNVKDASLGIISAVMGLVDGFNPCAMWILLFLISMLLGTKSRKRMWILGSTFLFTSAIMYLLFISLWLGVSIKIGYIVWIRTIIGVVAICLSIYNIKKYIDNRKKDVGCTVTNAKDKRKIINRIKKFINEKSLLISIFGIMLIAISVNLVELLCSAGLPMIYTQILTINNLNMNNFEYILNLIIYILFYMLDDIIIFLIAMFTLKITGISNKYTKFSSLIGGIIMLIIGLLLIFKPELLLLLRH